MKKIVLIKFGGSIMVPEWPDAEYLRNFVDFLKRLESEYRFILITGGGGINKKYNALAREVNEGVTDENLDWIGIAATRLNARLLIGLLGEKCNKKVVTNPTAEFEWQEDYLVGAGWKPGWSTDYDAMILADRLGAEKVITATDIDYIYDADPKQAESAKPLKHITWEELRAIVGDEWKPRMHIPMDPSATRYAGEKGMTVVSVNGRNLENMERAIKGEEFEGTVISNNTAE